MVSSFCLWSYIHTQPQWILFLCSHKTSEAESDDTYSYNYNIATFIYYITLAAHGSLYIFKPLSVYYVFLSSVIILIYQDIIV